MRTNPLRFIRTNFAAISFLVSLLFLFCVSSPAQKFRSVHRGVEHAQVTHKIGDDPVKINLLRLDLTRVRLDVHHAFDKAIGVETTSAIAQRHRAVAAINAGFFRLDKSAFAGDPAGVFAIDGKIWSDSHNNRVAIRIRNSPDRTTVDFFHPKTAVSFAYFTDVVRSLSGVNRERGPREIIAYTPEFGESTLADELGTEIVFRACAANCRIEVREKAGNSPIPRDGYVLSIGPERVETALLDFMRSEIAGGDGSTWARLQIFIERAGNGYEVIEPSDDITNGVPQLIRNGKIDITWEQEKASKSFVEMRHPRTAVAKLKGGKFLMIAVDGRQPGVSVGVTLQELAEYLLSIGATDAMNLDGGGSTTMFLDGKVVNVPSDKEGERKVSDAIVVTLRKNFRR